MATIPFVLPLNIKDLRDSNAESYYVREIYNLSYIKEQQRQARETFRLDGSVSIIKYFDMYYSILYHGENLSLEFIIIAFKDLQRLCLPLTQNLTTILKSDDAQIAEVKDKTLNILKMIMYLFSELVTLIESKIEIKKTNNINLINKGKGNKKSKNSSENEYFPKELKMKQINFFSEILELPIYKLWDPPVCEEQFINLISDICFIFLQDPSIKSETDLWQGIFNIFGILIKNYNYSMTFIVRLTQVIKNEDNLESIVPNGVKILVEEYNCSGIIRQLVRELTEWQSDENVVDQSGSKRCSVVLTSLTRLMPELMLPEVVYLLQYLNYNAYTLRICILSIITEVVMAVLSHEEITEEQIEIRNEFLLNLLNHIRDVNAHVRSKVLQLWLLLLQEQTIPKDMQLDVLKQVCGRLTDRGTLVRKSAIQLVTGFLEYNLYAASLNLDKFEKDLHAEIVEMKTLAGNEDIDHNVLKVNMQRRGEWTDIENTICNAIKEIIEDDEEPEFDPPEKITTDLIRSELVAKNYGNAFLLCKCYSESKSENNTEFENLSEKDKIEFFITLMQSIYTDAQNSAQYTLNLKLQTLAALPPETLEKIEQCEGNIKFFLDVIVYLNIIDGVFPTMKKLLNSAAMSDVTEAIEFFITAYKFNIKNSVEGLTAMLLQMNTTDKDRKKLVIDAYKNLFLSPDDDRNLSIAQKLIVLVRNIKLNEMTYLTDIIKEWTLDGDLSNSILQVFFKMFTGQIRVSEMDCLAVMKIIAMIGLGRRLIIERNRNLIVELAFKDKALKNPQFIIIGCEMLSILGNDPINVMSTKPCFRISNKEPMWDTLLTILTKIYERKDEFCHKVLSRAVELIYKISQKPDLLCEQLLKNVLTILKTTAEQQEKKVDSYHLACFCHLLGEVAIQQFQFLNVSTYKELKRRNYIRDERKKEKKEQGKQNQVMNASIVSKASATSRAVASDMPEDETGLEGATADDAESEFIVKICETELVTKNMLGHYRALLEDIVSHPQKYHDQLLQTSATQALTRFMIVSSEICRSNLNLIMTILEKSEYPAVKNNIFIALADMLYRFPNVVEPWNKHIFKTLKDPNKSVRITAVSVLSKLILEDMLIVKGTIADLVMCICDPCDDIVQLTEDFFKLLAQKGNSIYNVLPDILSQLSNNHEQIDEDTFKKVTAFLVSLIDKDKQIEFLVRKLCLRFKLSENVRVWRDIAYCLTLLSYNEKSLIGLQENFPGYKHSLEDDIVYDFFISIINKYKVSSKDEIKNASRRLEHLIRTGESKGNDSLRVFFRFSRSYNNVVVSASKTTKGRKKRKN